MDERWAAIEAAVQRALDLPEPERDGALAKACAGDADLLAEARSLLRACESSAGFLETPAPALAGRSSPTHDEAPERIGPYRIGERIGEGGMGSVYLAEQEGSLRRRVALKLIRLGMNSREVVARFEAERQALALMDHPNIARVYDAGAAPDGRPYFVMEHVPGAPITTWCDEAQLGPRARLELFVEVCDAVQHAHQKGVIHRDLKPSNILVNDTGERPTPKIIEFGVAKAVAQPLTERTLLTEQGQLLGTPEYMSPEQAGAGAIDTRTDIYSLGVLLYELLVGALPFDPRALRAAGYAEIQRRIREDEPPRPSTRLSSLGALATDFAQRRGVDLPRLLRELRGDLDWITLRAMEKSPDRRYASASELAADIRRHLDGEPVVARPPTASYRVAKFMRRNRALVAGAVAVSAALLLGAAGATWQAILASTERDRARAAEADAQRALNEAEEQTALAEAINEFLNEDLIAAARPDRLGRDVTVRDAIDAAAELVGGRFADQPRTEAAVRTTLGYTFLELGDFDRSALHLERALKIHRAEGTDDELAGALTLHLLGRVFDRQGRYDEAERATTDALAIRERELGPADPRTSATRNTLATIEFARGHYDEAAALFERIHADLETAVGPTDRRTLIALGNLASILPWTGDAERSNEIIAQLVVARTEALGREHPDTIRALALHAAALGRQDRHDEAIAVAEESLALHREVLGDEHPATATAVNDLGVALTRAGRDADAEPHIREALRRTEQIRGREHLYALTIRRSLASCLYRLGREDESAALRRENYLAARKSLPPDHQKLAEIIHDHAFMLGRARRDAEAIALFAESYGIYERTLGPDHATTRSEAKWIVVLCRRSGDAERLAYWSERTGEPPSEASGGDPSG